MCVKCGVLVTTMMIMETYRVFTRSSKHRAGSNRPIRTPPVAQM